MPTQDNTPSCGACCWFYSETLDGFGFCAKGDYPKEENLCSDEPCDGYKSRQQMRHHLATLIHHNLWRRDNSVPNSRRQDDPKEIGEAIDFAVEYIKEFSKQ